MLMERSDQAAHGSWAITNGTWPADPAYYKGRFSKCAHSLAEQTDELSGPVWPELVAHHLQIGLRNYAVGGGAPCCRSSALTRQPRQTVRDSLSMSKLTCRDDLVQGHTCVAVGVIRLTPTEATVASPSPRRRW